ncbi:MAG: hypothetical protein H5T92_02300 [Synergistales bacterium]|nr:hypothetical protein [Synergistales bacterium]
MATCKDYGDRKLTLAACTMGLVSKQPQLGVAIFERIPRKRKEGMITARIDRPLEEINKVMEDIQKHTGIFGWTIVPHEKFFEVVLCSRKSDLDFAQHKLAQAFQVKVKRVGGTLHYIGGETREKAQQKYIERIKELVGRRARDYLTLVAHNVPRQEFIKH